MSTMQLRSVATSDNVVVLPLERRAPVAPSAKDGPRMAPSAFEWERADGYCPDCRAELHHDAHARHWSCLRCATVVWLCPESCGEPGSACAGQASPASPR